MTVTLRSPVHRPWGICAALVLLSPLLVAPVWAAQAEDPGPAPGRVRLVGDSDSVVSSATVPLGADRLARRTGTVGLRTPKLATTAYEMVGLTWRADTDPAIAIRTRSQGRWTRWTDLERLEDGPTSGSLEGRQERVAGATGLLWVGTSTGIQVRSRRAAPAGLELVLIDPGVLSSDKPVEDSSARSAQPLADTSARSTTPRPQLRSRRKWDADPTWRNGRPRHNRSLKQVHVHHTATANGYARADVPAILRGMYRYHTRNLGWFDLGYNFLVDRFGRAWVGRSGGAHKLVRGAHTLGFNNTSVGISVIGNYEANRPSSKVVGMIAKLAAWKLDRHGRAATGKVRVKSQGSDRFADGQRVRLPVIDGHRDTNETACPGESLYRLLPAIRSRTQKRIDRY